MDENLVNESLEALREKHPCEWSDEEITLFIEETKKDYQYRQENPTKLPSSRTKKAPSTRRKKEKLTTGALVGLFGGQKNE